MFTSSLAEITEINGRMLTIKPLGVMGGVTPPVIYDVPLGMIGNEENYTDHKLKIGDIILIMFLTFNMGNYIGFGSKDTIPDLNLNDYNNAIALPIVFNKAILEIALPESISQVGNIKHNGDTSQEGKQVSSGEILSNEDVKAQNISLKNHTHKYNPGPGSPTPTSVPN